MMKGELSKNGFVERILFVYPRIQSKALPSMKELPKSVDDKWRDTIKTLLDLPFEKNAYGDAMPAVINFTDEAKEFLENFPYNQVVNIKSISQVTMMLNTGEMNYYIDDCDQSRYKVQSKYAVTSQEFNTLLKRHYGRLT